jgi:hypothetical protein
MAVRSFKFFSLIQCQVFNLSARYHSVASLQC